jgi:hypothetical protein
VGSFTLTDRIDAPTQGEIGETLTYDGVPAIATPPPVYTENDFEASDFSINPETGTIIASGRISTTAFAIRRSTDGGMTWSSITLPPIQEANSIGVCVNNVWIVLALRRAGGAGTNILRSVTDGVSWTAITINNNAFSDLIYVNSRFLAIARKTEGGNTSIVVHYSTDGNAWTEVNCNVVNASQVYPCRMAVQDTTVVVVGYRLILPNNNEPVILRSNDGGLSWQDISLSLKNSPGYAVPLSPLTTWRAGGKWYIYCRNALSAEIWSSADLSSWSRVQTSFQYLEDNGIMNPISGARVDVTELFGWPVLRGKIAPSNEPRLTKVEHNTVTYLSYIIPYLTFGQRIIKYAGDEYYFAGVRISGSLNAITRKRILPASIHANSTNIAMSSNADAIVNDSVQIANFTISQTDRTALHTFNNCTVLQTRAISVTTAAARHDGNELIIKRCILKSNNIAYQVNGAAAADNDLQIVQCAIIGGLQLNNSNSTDRERIVDNIIEGDFTAAALVTVKSNIRGAVVNASGTSKISTINPLFVDDVDYELSRVALGQNVDSPLIKLSASYFYSYNNTIYPDDLGPHRVFAALLQTAYKRAFLLPKFSGDALNEDVENVAALIKSINGVPDVSNQPRGRLEIVSWQSKAVDSSVREFISFMERQRNTQCELYYDFDETALDDIVVNGAHSSGTFELNIQPKDIPVGTVLTLFGQLRYVVQRYPRSGEATKLVLDDVLSGGLANGATIPIAQIQGAGTFVFVPEQRRTNRRIFSRRRDAYAGMKYTFVRKAL